MSTKLKYYLIPLFLFCFLSFFSQNNKTASTQTITLDPEKVKLFIKYIEYKHSSDSGGFKVWSTNNPELFEKEKWYYTESFYIKRDYLTNGITMNERMIDVSRFEVQRKEDEEVIVTFGGYKDVMVLIPGNRLIYKPE